MVSRIKPLNQDDFKMKIIEDLGRLYPTKTSKHKTRFAIFECTNCKKHFKATATNIKQRQTEVCEKCSYRGRRETHGLSTHKLYSVWSNQKARCKPRPGITGGTEYARLTPQMKLHNVCTQCVDQPQKVA